MKMKLQQKKGKIYEVSIENHHRSHITYYFLCTKINETKNEAETNILLEME